MGFGVRSAALPWILAAALAAAPAPAAENTAGQDAELAKKLSNPISDLVSIPFQFNWESGVGPDNGLRTILNIQPVLPMALNGRWNLIERWIMPFVSQPEFFGAASGLGDITFSSFFSPARASDVLWGVGPVFSLPMTSDPALGSGQWSLGPTAVLLKMKGPWTYGILWNQLWSFARVSDLPRADVNQGFFQPFLAHNTKTGMTYTLQSESTANWQAEKSGDVWTIPLNFIVSKITTLGPFPFSVQGGFGVFLAAPDGGPEWKLRTNFVVLLPRKK